MRPCPAGRIALKEIFRRLDWTWAKSGVKPERIMPAEDVAWAMLDVYRLGRRTVVESIVLRPQLGDV